MSPRAAWAIAGGVASVFIAYLLLQSRDEPAVLVEAIPLPTEPEKTPEPAAEPMEDPAAVEPVAEPSGVSFFEPGDEVDERKPHLLRHYGSGERTGRDDIELVRGVLESYWQIIKDPDQLTAWSNEDLIRCLAGANAFGIEFVSPSNRFLDARGRLLDRWGNELFFHSNSVTDIEIRSNGPDGDRFTEDDILVRATTPVRTKR